MLEFNEAQLNAFLEYFNCNPEFFHQFSKSILPVADASSSGISEYTKGNPDFFHHSNTLITVEPACEDVKSKTRYNLCANRNSNPLFFKNSRTLI